jgi:hypothetical protein
MSDVSHTTSPVPIADLHPGDVIAWAGASGDGAVISAITEADGATGDGGRIVTIVWHSPRTDQWHTCNLNWREGADHLFTIVQWAQQ